QVSICSPVCADLLFTKEVGVSGWICSLSAGSGFRFVGSGRLDRHHCVHAILARDREQSAECFIWVRSGHANHPRVCIRAPRPKNKRSTTEYLGCPAVGRLAGLGGFSMEGGA